MLFDCTHPGCESLLDIRIDPTLQVDLPWPVIFLAGDRVGIKSAIRLANWWNGGLQIEPDFVGCVAEDVCIVTVDIG